MDLNLVTTVAGIVAASAVAYHIAIRSGTFWRPSLRLRIGHQFQHKRYRPPLVMLFGIPRTPKADYFAVQLPLIVECRFGTVRNLFVRFVLPEDRDTSRTRIMRKFVAELPEDGALRKQLNSGEVNTIDYEIPVLRRSLPARISEVLVFHRDEIHEPPSGPRGVKFVEVLFHSCSENSNSVAGSVLACAVWSDIVETLQSVALNVGLAARIHRGLSVLTPNRWGFVLLPPPHTPWKRRVDLSQLRVTDLDERHALFLGEKGIVIAQTLDFLPVYFPPKG